MTAEHYTRVPFVDLTHVVIRCRACGAEGTVDITDERQARVWTGGRAMTCVGCGQQFPEIVKAAVANLRTAVTSAAAAGDGSDISVRLTTEQHPPA